MKPLDEFEAAATRLSRRRFLSRVGVGAAGAAVALRLDWLLCPQAEAAPLASGLPATDAVRTALMDMGKQGGILDANDALSQGPAALITNPLFNGSTPRPSPTTSPILPAPTSWVRSWTMT